MLHYLSAECFLLTYDLMVLRLGLIVILSLVTSKSAVLYAFHLCFLLFLVTPYLVVTPLAI